LECAVLGAILQDPKSAIETAIGLLRTHDVFYFPAHQVIFDACVRIHKRRLAPDAMNVVEELRARDLLEQVSGESYIYALTAAVPDASQVDSHCRRLRELHLMRQAIEVGQNLQKAMYEREEMPRKAIAGACEKLAGIASQLEPGEVITSGKAAEQFIAEGFDVVEDDAGEEVLRRRWGLVTDYPEIDHATRGFQKGNLIILGARPGVGKTALALNFMYNFAKKGIACAIFSYEQSAAEIGERLLAIASGVSNEEMAKRTLSRQTVAALRRGYEELQGLPIFMDDDASLDVYRLRDRATRLVSRRGVKFIAVDYLQLMPSEDSAGNEHLRIAGITRALKQTARMLEVPILVASQVKREVDARTYGEVKLGDLRESGAIEADADIVMGAWDYVGEKGKRRNGNGRNGDAMNQGEGARRVRVRFLKNRNGPKGWISDFLFLPGRMRMEQFYPGDIPSDMEMHDA